LPISAVAARSREARADYRRRGFGGRAARGLLRQDGCAARHGAESFIAAALHHRDGAAGDERSGRNARRETESAAFAATARRARRACEDGARSIQGGRRDRKSTRLNSSHVKISYAV